jgi:class 3 adenylate cyclase/pimeloyl-ACP methyl ester carboxylesterase
MEPDIRYCSTSDGVSIAYYAMGDGPTLLIASTGTWGTLPHTSIYLPELQREGVGVGRGMRVVRYDSRGMGLSDRAAIDFSLEARMRDIEAVVRRLDLTTFALVGQLYGALAAVEYAARNPENVSKLVLSNPVVNGAEMRRRLRQWDSLRDMANEEWEAYTNTLAAANVGFDRPELLQIMARRMRESGSPASIQASFQALSSIDVAPSLKKLTMPALVMYRPLVSRTLSLEDAQAVADAIPTAQLVHTSLAAGEFWSQADTDAVERFLGVAPEAGAAEAHAQPATAPAQRAGVLQTILFTDIEANTELLQRLGDEPWRRLLREHEVIIRSELARHGGAEIKTMGDGFMASFSSAARALECAVALQRAFEAHNAGKEHPLHVRIGLNAGEPIAEGNDLYGTAVTMASRIQSLAQGGEILVSDVVRQLVAGKGFLFSDRGEAVLRGFEDPVRLYEVRWQE